jgi:hypothetical protein
MKRALVIAVAVGAVLLVWAALYFPSSGDTSSVQRPAPVEAPQEPVAGIAAPPSAERAPVAPAAQPAVAKPAPAAASASPQPSTAPARQPQLRPERMGPVDELKVAYERDARDADAGAMEERIRGHFDDVELPPELLRKVSCVRSVCKLEVRWTPAHREAYMIAMMNLVSHVSEKLAAEPVTADEGQEVRPIDVYVSRTVPPYTPTGSN